MRTCMLAIFVALLATPLVAAYPVGFEVLSTNPVVSVWYPARNDGTAMRLRDYYGSKRRDEEAFLKHAGLSAHAIAAFMDVPMHARRGATALGESRPLVLIAQGNGEDAPDQAFLAEELAAHGYVVASTPSPMIATPMHSENEIGRLAEQQASDLARAIGIVASVFPVQQSDIAVVGHSFGARAALLLAMEQPAVRTLVSLDGGIGTTTESTR